MMLVFCKKRPMPSDKSSSPANALSSRPAGQREDVPHRAVVAAVWAHPQSQHSTASHSQRRRQPSHTGGGKQLRQPDANQARHIVAVQVVVCQRDYLAPVGASAAARAQRHAGETRSAQPGVRPGAQLCGAGAALCSGRTAACLPRQITSRMQQCERPQTAPRPQRVGSRLFCDELRHPGAHPPRYIPNGVLRRSQGTRSLPSGGACRPGRHAVRRTGAAPPPPHGAPGTPAFAAGTPPPRAGTAS
jgi:hypothetical protein